MIGALPNLLIGQNEKGENIEINAKNRPRGIAIIGQPGTGKSSLTIQLIEQDIKSGCGVLVVEPHDLIKELLPRIPKDRWDDVVIISLRHERPPIWPVLDIARKNSEQLIIASLLIDSWRAQFGKESIGPRAEGILQNALLLFPRELSISPLELMTVIVNKNFREKLLQTASLEGEQYPLSLYWQHSMGALGERVVQEWAQAVTNKLSPFLLNDWLRLASCGTAPAKTYKMLHPTYQEPQIPFEAAFDDPKETNLAMITWLKDGVLGYRYGDEPRPQICKIDTELERFLISTYRKGKIYSNAFPDGYTVDREYTPDLDDPWLKPPSPNEVAEYGDIIQNDVNRRRRRRGWAHMVDFLLKPANILAREAIDIADMLDDRRIVLVEVPTIYGSEVTSLAGTMAFLSAVARGHRQLALPPHRRVPCAVYIDEASLFLNEGIERTLAELRKADVSLTIILQRLGQLGPVNSPFRRGVIDTIGTIITLPVGIEEVRDVAHMFDNDTLDKMRALTVGEGMISTLGEKGNIGKATAFNFLRPAPSQDQGVSQQLRNLSIARYYQSILAAQAIFKERITAMNSFAPPLNKEAGVAKNKKSGNINDSDQNEQVFPPLIED